MARTKKEKVKPNWLDPNTTAENEVLPRYLKWAWTSRAVALATNVVLIMQLTYYCTDMLKMSAGLVGALLLASKLFDGVTDLVVGFIIDKTHTKYGKARPYEICIVFVWLFTILLFSTPEFGIVGKSVFVFIMYTLINSICATFLNGGDAVYCSRSIRSEKNRVSVLAFSGSVMMLCSIVISMVLPQLIATVGAVKSGWTTISCIFGIPFGLIGILRFVFVKEVAGESADKNAPASANNITFKTSVRCVLQNKYIWILAAMTFCVMLITNVGSAVGTYYFKYIIGNIGLASLLGMTSLITPFAMMLFPVLARKFGTVNLVRGGAVMGIVGYGLRTLGGTNLVTLMIGSLLATMAVLPISMMINIYLIDCMDYGEWKTGTRVEGMLNSITAFSNKLGSGLASGLVGLIMGLAGYEGSLAVQSAAANTSIVALFNYMPLVLTIVLLVFSIAYKTDKIMPQIRAELAERKTAE